MKGTVTSGVVADNLPSFTAEELDAAAKRAPPELVKMYRGYTPEQADAEVDRLAEIERAKPEKPKTKRGK